MYVIEQGDTDNPIYYPADRCTWQLFYDTGDDNYKLEVNTVIFWNGASTSGTTIKDSTSDRARLGVLGKTGRFVPMTAE